ncbi:MAG: hypothetical protein ISP90_18285 [Nevskia sp.]|nr:hypothetical protein [Nevskia sp.]
MNHDQMEKILGGPAVAGRPGKSAASSWWRPNRERHLWCTHCSRTCPNGTYRCLAGRKVCPYADCAAEVAPNARAWSLVRAAQPNYPQVPWMGVQYPYNRPREALEPITRN